MISNKTSDRMAIKNKFHEINNYIRDNIVLTKAQKLIFISSILICLKSDMDYIESYKLQHKTTQSITQKMIDTIQETFNDNCFTHQFEFIQTNVNSEHLIYVMTLVKESLSEFEKKENDILNAFFREFTLWESNSEGKLGIVLTPNDIVQHMVQTLEIKPTDKVLDFCTGTSSFLVAASKFTKNVYGCERDDINYTIAKCNFILHNIPTDHLVHSSCFDYSYTPTFDKIILNPPFACQCKDQKNLSNLEKSIPKDQLISWQNFTNEQRFVLYGIQLLKEGGKGSFIIPRSNFGNNTNKNDPFKQEILKHCQITSLITLSTKVFQPNASVQCSILNVIKTPVGLEKKPSNVVDFTNDGFKIKKNVRIQISKPEPKIQKRILTINDDWNYVSESAFDHLTLEEIQNYNIQQYVIENKKRIKQKIPIIKQLPEYIPESLSQDTTKFQTAKVKEYFKLINPEKRFQVQNSQEGPYPLISRSSTQNGTVKYINDYSLQGLFITVAPSGSTGATFLQEGRFAVDGQIKVLQPIKDLSKETLHVIAHTLNKTFTSIYSYNNGLTNQKLLDQEIQIPLTPNLQPDQEIQPEYQTIKLKDYFKLVVPEKKLSLQNTEDGPYPLIGSSETNNGIVKYINGYNMDGTFITVARTGSAGATFLQEGKFSVNDGIKILQPIKDLPKETLHAIVLILNKTLTSKYSYNNGLTNQKLLDEEIQIPLTPNLQLDQEIQPELQTIKIEDHFELIIPEKQFQIQDTQDGPYPLISSSGQNNGVVKYINEYSLDGTFITVARTGSTGATYLQEGKFAITPNVLVLKLIDENITSEQLHLITFVLNNHLLNKYSYNNLLSKQKILQEEIQIPVIIQQ